MLYTRIPTRQAGHHAWPAVLRPPQRQDRGRRPTDQRGL